MSKTENEKNEDRKDDRKEDSNDNSWKLHNTYGPGASFSRIVTRSQTAFCRIKNSESDLDLFADKNRHQPPGKPHLMVVMKGEYGAIPNTIITRSTGKYMSESKDLIKQLDEYKEYKPSEKSKENDEGAKDTDEEANESFEEAKKTFEEAKETDKEAKETDEEAKETDEEAKE